MSMAADGETRILVLYTGGTIGMLKADGGYAPHPGFLASNLRSQKRFHDPTGQSVWTNSTSVAAFSQWSASRTASPSPARSRSLPIPAESKDIEVLTSAGPLLLPSLVTPRFAQGKRIRYCVWEYERLIDSSEIEPQDFLRIAGDIERNYPHFDAFLVLHGTDTMAFSAAALSFLLEDLGKTVILTGAQIPLSELFTDAIDNLLGSLILAGHFIIPEVCLFFDNTLLRGNRAIKFSSEAFAAFQSPNLAPLATVGIDVDVAWSQVLRPGPRPFRAHTAFSSDVATLRIFPGITAAAVRAFLRPGGVRGVVIESYGAGNAPRRPELLSAFREATEQHDMVIVNVTQCVTGSVAPDIYETGRALAAVGVVGGGDMTTEAALAKLSYLLSKTELSPAQIRRLLAQPLRGELTHISPIPTYSSPASTETRLQTLFSQIIDLAPSSRRGPCSPAQKTVSLPDASSTSSLAVPLPEEFSTQPTLADEEALRAAVMPYLLSQAASRPDGSLAALLSTLDAPPPIHPSIGTGTSISSTPLALPSLLNEPSTSTLQTPLHLAVLASLPSNVDLLLSHGASVHARDIAGHSALFYAAKQGGGLEAVRMVKALRAAGAHLGEMELESGAVGLEVIKAEKTGDPSWWEVWNEAASEEDLKKAKAVVADLLA